MEHHNPKRMASPYPHEEVGDYIPMPHEFHQPPLSHKNRYNPNLYRPWEAYGGESRPHPHHIRPPPSPQSHHHPHSNPQEDKLEALMHRFMEDTKKVIHDVDSKIETINSSLKEKFEVLIDQFGKIESRLVQLEEIEEVHTRHLHEDKDDIVDIKHKIDQTYDQLEETVKDTKEDLGKLNKELNSVAIKAYQAAQAVEEVKTTKGELTSKVEELETDTRLTVQTLNAIRYDLDHHTKELTATTTKLGEEAINISNQVKQLDDRLKSIEETVQIPFQLETIEEEFAPTANCCTLTALKEDESTSNQDEDEVSRPLKKTKTSQGKLTARISVKPRPYGLKLAERTPKRTRFISDEMLQVFNSLVKELPKELSFEEVWRERPSLRKCFSQSKEEDFMIEELFDRARNPHKYYKILCKTLDPGPFNISCSIRGFKFDDALCDSGAGINVLSESLVRMMKITNLRPSRTRIALANGASTLSLGEIHNCPLNIGDCIIPVDFEVATMNDCSTPFILGRPFLATAGAIMDYNLGRISFTNIDTRVYHYAAPPGFRAKQTRYIPSEKREVLINEPNQFDEDGEHDLRRPHLHAKGNLKPLEDLPPP